MVSYARLVRTRHHASRLLLSTIPKLTGTNIEMNKLHISDNHMFDQL